MPASSHQTDGQPAFPRALLLATLTLYWATGTITSSMLPYWNYRHIEGAALQRKEQGHLFHHFPAGGVALKNLPQPAPEGALQRQEPLAAVIFGSIVAQAPRRQERSEAGFNLGEGGLAEGFEGFLNATGSHGSQNWSELREVIGHRAVYIPPY